MKHQLADTGCKGRMTFAYQAALKCTPLLLVLSIFMPATAKAADIADVVGIWRTHNGLLVNFYPCGSGFCGKLASTPKGFAKDKHNPNPKLKARAVKGLTIIRSTKKSGEGKWSGTVYNYENGRTYRGSLKLNGKRSAKLTGCDGAFCQSATWTKIRKTRLANN